ncbi:MAG: host attachment protein [Gammaproteobacteria bacterium]|nr:host attachment protein [Gammaproteobacteria bacterium]MDH5736231.1 host attachment protein [Gammaproteobacteria bacterium]
MSTTWVIVADSSRARIFTAETSTSSLQEIETLAHPEGRLHDKEIVSDLPGKVKGNGTGGHAYQDEVTPKEQEVINFAKRVASHLSDAHNVNKFHRLAIVAAPAFLGELRNQMSSQLNKLVCFDLNKNITLQSAEEIRKHLPKSLPVI